MERDGHVEVLQDGRDRRSRLVVMTDRARHVWNVESLPKITAYYEQALTDFSFGDLSHVLYYLFKLLDNMKTIDLNSEAPIFFRTSLSQVNE